MADTKRKPHPISTLVEAVEDHELVTTNEAARILGVTSSNAGRYLRTLSPIPLSNGAKGTRAYVRSEVEALRDARSSPSEPSTD